jgi:hypothetical protein
MSTDLTTQYPRVSFLSYRIISGDSHKFATEAELEGHLAGFRFHLRGEDAVFFPLEHFSSEVEARSALDPQLRAWELATALTEGLDVLAFKFLYANLEKAPPEPGVTIVPFVAQLTIGGLAPRVIVTHGVHRSPPTGFAMDECVETLGALLLFAKRTPHALLYVAYSMTTCVETYHGPQPNVAASSLGFSANVFQRINELANTRGVGAEARKFVPGATRTQLSTSERAWLLQMLELIVRRAAAVAAGESPGDKITLSSQPQAAG